MSVQHPAETPQVARTTAATAHADVGGTDSTCNADATGTADSTGGAPGRRGRRRRIVVPLVLAVAVGGAGVVVAVRPWEQGGAAGQEAPEHGAVAVERGSLSSGIQVAGSLGYDAPTPVVGAGSGTLTALPAVGDVIKAGARLYEVDGRPVTFMTGKRPLWRTLEPGVPDGPDVRQLKANLRGLGHAAGLALAEDDKFTEGTATAVKRWQKALGVQQTGAVALGSVVMLPRDAVQVQKLATQLGSAVATATVMTVSGTDLVAVVQPSDSQVSRFKPDGKVVVKLAEGGTVDGRIRSLVRGGAPDGGPGAGGGEGGGGGGPQKTTVTIVLDGQDRVRQAGPSPVTVNVVGDTAADALIVPVTALLALSGGGYGVKVVEGSGSRLVPVRLGLVADARAQITGDVKSGDQVVVPK
ncbi:peptidoglycan-binding protein [Streptomyces sp. NPDC004667]|uniref:peptidoglycan-binding protein n=1 Tax=Streptomyces sp. NPDC004667 TaxID=3154285 RepID=UPI0033A20AD8